ncbi:MAG: HlyD family efflux transporter periplasmic adaptor subunit [Pseudomonadota bacterium]
MSNIEQSIEAEDARIGTYLWAGRIVVLILILGAGGWATFSQISGAVIASGSIAVEARSKSLQHLEGGIVRELLVKDGDLVRKDQLLARLDAGQLNQQISGLSAELKAKRLEIELVSAELDGLSTLAKKGLIPKARVLGLKRQVARLRGEHGKLKSAMARSEDQSTRLELRAPIDGYVHNLAFHTIGGVVPPGKEIMQIVPSSGPMVARLRVDPANIDEVSEGQTTVIRLSGFNQRTTPEITGKIVHVSADLNSDRRTNSNFYVAHSALPAAELNQLGLTLLPGMPVEAFIQKESRSALSYLIRPLTDQLARAFREE